jgi:hypothetical protein
MLVALTLYMGYANGEQAMIGVHEDTRDRLATLKGDRSYDALLNELADRYRDD